MPNYLAQKVAYIVNDALVLVNDAVENGDDDGELEETMPSV